uniref:Uncharacterized protein n=1 Tax=Acrobeloides nanus TaxID=290746 RepID=A0A914CB12_9BILA
MQNWLLKGYFKLDLQARPVNSKVFVSLEELIKRNGAKTPFIQKSDWAPKPKNTNKSDENQYDNQLQFIINKLLEMDKRHNENIKEIRQVLQRQNERIAALQIEWVVMKNKFEKHDCTCSLNEKSKEGEKKEEKENLYLNKEKDEKNLYLNKEKNNNALQNCQTSNGDVENQLSDEYSEDEEKSSGFEDNRTNSSTPTTVEHPKYQVLATKSFCSNGCSYYLNLKMSGTNDIFATAHMFCSKSNIKREFTMKIDAVEQMAEIFENLADLITKNLDPVMAQSNKTKTLIEYLPNETKQKLKLFSWGNVQENSVAKPIEQQENVEIKFEKQFTSFHWKYMIKAIDNGQLCKKSIIVICKHIKNKQSSIEFSYDGVLEFNEMLKEILKVYYESSDKKNSNPILKSTNKYSALKSMNN